MTCKSSTWKNLLQRNPFLWEGLEGNGIESEMKKFKSLCCGVEIDESPLNGWLLSGCVA
jgi:hypothetical protein